MKSLVLRSYFVICATCFVLLLLSSFIGKALPTDRLVYLSGQLDQSNLYAIDIHRGLTHKVNNNELLSYAMSPDGEQILFLQPISDRAFAIFTMSLNGSNVRQLVEQPSFSPAWSPDSRYIAFVMYDESSNSTQIYRVKRDGTDLKALTQLATGENPFSPIWSPDGTRILFQSTAAGNKLNTYFMNADGSDLQLVSYPNDFEVFASTSQWSPNNRYLAFAGQTIDNKDQIIESSVCLLALGTDDLRCLADDVFSIFAWSRDSKQIAYVSSKGYMIFNLEIVNIETGETRRILRYSEITPIQINNINYLMWTLDGSALVYELSISGSRDNATQLYIINADGSGERKLTDGNSTNYAAAWWPSD